MNIKLFYHSLISDWNHGNAHFLRGVCFELLKKGYTVTVYEPEDGWSYQNLLKDKGVEAVEQFKACFPNLQSEFYDENSFRPEDYLQNTDLVIVHEWNNPAVVQKIGTYAAEKDDLVALFHDTHHRSVTEPEEMEKYNLTGYDGVLAFGEVIAQLYRGKGWAKDAWTWHEAADINIYHPMVKDHEEGDLVWIGNWGDNERTEELHEFIIEPVRKLGLKATFYGVRYPKDAIQALEGAGIEYRGWLPTHQVPSVFAKYKFTVHVPRRPYVENLPGIPTIRPFEAMACKIPLISAPWDDTERLFTNGEDYLRVENGEEMVKAMDILVKDELLRKNLSENGLHTIHSKHTCAHRVAQLMNIYESIASKQSRKILI